MFTSEPKQLTDLSQVFLEPANSTHRQYEALRLLRGPRCRPRSCPPLRLHPRQLSRPGPSIPPGSPPLLLPDPRPRDLSRHRRPIPSRELIITLRKQNLSIYDISRSLAHQGQSLSPVTVAQVLKSEGFARLPRRADDERPAGTRPTTADVADVRQLDLNPRAFSHPSSAACSSSCRSWPRSPSIGCSARRFSRDRDGPAGCALRSLLALKLFGTSAIPMS